MLKGGISKYASKTCLCGCGEFVKLHVYLRKNGGGNSYLVCDFIRGHDKRGVGGFNSEIHTPRLCTCGCGKQTGLRRGRYNRFIKKHENIRRLPWNKGKPFSEEVKKKMSLARLGKEPVNKTPIDPQKLYRLYVQDKKNISCVSKELGISKDSVKNRLQALGWSRSTKESCSTETFRSQMRTIRIRALTSKPVVETPNKLERLIYETLDQIGVPYQKQAPLFNKFVVDVLFPQRNLILEIFGRYWHELPVNQKKDFSKKKYLEKCGYKVEIIWDDEIKRIGSEPLLQEIYSRYNLI